MTFKVNLISNKEGFEAIKDTWNELVDQIKYSNIFLTWEWNFYWWDNFGKDSRLHIIEIKDEFDKVYAIFPLKVTVFNFYLFKIQLLENICSSDGCDYSGFIIRENEEQFTSLFFEYLDLLYHKDILIVLLSQQPSDSNIIMTLNKIIKTPRIYSTKKISTCPYIPLPDKHEDFCSQLSKKKRKNLRLSLKTIKKMGNLQFETITHKNIEPYLNILFKMHQKRWNIQGIESKFEKSEVMLFYKQLSLEFDRKKWLSFTAIKLGENIISLVWGFTFKGRYYYMTPSFDIRYSEFSVGNIHIAFIIKNLIFNNIKVFDFLKGDEKYKHEWTKTNNYNLEIVITRCFLKDRLALFFILKYRFIKPFFSRTIYQSYKLFLKRMEY